MVRGWDHLQAGGFRDGVFPPVRLKVADHNIDSLSYELLRFLQHAVGLANARGIPEEYLQLAAIAWAADRRRSLR